MNTKDITLLPFQLENIPNSFTVLTPNGIKTFTYKTIEDMERNKQKLISLLNKN